MSNVREIEIYNQFANSGKLVRCNSPGALYHVAIWVAKLARPRLLLATSAGCVGTWLLYRVIVKAFFKRFGSGAIGPYPTSCNDPRNLLSYVNRWLINVSRKNLRIDLFPTESFHDVNPSRIGDNGHPVSGGVRDAARVTIQSIVTSAGYDKFELSPAKQSRADGSSHQHFAVGDLYKPACNDFVQTKHIVTGIDVDYYATDPTVLLGHFQPTLFYTFNPVAVSGTDGECRFSIRGNMVDFIVPGGGLWRHGVWDWCAAGEFVQVGLSHRWYHKLASLIGLKQFVYHKITHYRPWPSAPHRALVMTTPQYSTWMFPSLPNDLRARNLERVNYMDPNMPGWNKLIIPRDGRFFVNFGREGEFACGELPLGTFEELMATKNTQSVTTRMVSLGIDNMHVRMLVGQYHSGIVSNISTTAEVVRPARPIVHWPTAMTCDPKPPNYRQYGAPLVSDENMVPFIKRWEALSVSIDNRITYVQNNTQPPQWLASMADRWVRMLVPEAHVGVPLSFEEARDELDKPSQILAVKAVWDCLDVEAKTYIECFLKNEPCNKPARVISSFSDAKFLLSISRFTIAFRRQVLENDANKHWFMPGKSPTEIANRLCDYVRSIGEPLEGDYANLDGTVSRWLQRNVMIAPYFRYYAPEYHSELRRDTNPLITNPARAKSFGFAYEPGFGVKSGGSNTCDGNCHCLCFIMFASILRTMPHLTDEEAWILLGMVLGDDSMFDEQFGYWFRKISAMLGLKLKCEKFNHDNGVCFLARVYPDPWSTNTSFQDPLRTWRKLHITSRDKNVDLADAAFDRCTGYAAIDPYTPVTSNYVNMMIRHYGPLTTQRRLLRRDKDREKPYWSYKYENDAWPQNPEDIPLMRRVISNRVHVPIENLLKLEEKLDSCNDVWSESITLDRTEFELPYSKTVLPDGTLTEDVDARQVEDERERINIRNPAGVTRSGRAAVDALVGEATGSSQHNSGRTRNAGPEGVPHVSSRHNNQGGQVNRQPVGETSGRGRTQRRATTRTENSNRRGRIAGHPGRGSGTAEGRSERANTEPTARRASFDNRNGQAIS